MLVNVSSIEIFLERHVRPCDRSEDDTHIQFKVKSIDEGQIIGKNIKWDGVRYGDYLIHYKGISACCHRTSEGRNGLNHNHIGDDYVCSIKKKLVRDDTYNLCVFHNDHENPEVEVSKDFWKGFSTLFDEMRIGKQLHMVLKDKEIPKIDKNCDLIIIDTGGGPSKINGVDKSEWEKWADETAEISKLTKIVFMACSCSQNFKLTKNIVLCEQFSMNPYLVTQKQLPYIDKPRIIIGSLKQDQCPFKGEMFGKCDKFLKEDPSTKLFAECLDWHVFCNTPDLYYANMNWELIQLLYDRMNMKYGVNIITYQYIMDRLLN